MSFAGTSTAGLSMRASAMIAWRAPPMAAWNKRTLKSEGRWETAPPWRMALRRNRVKKRAPARCSGRQQQRLQNQRPQPRPVQRRNSRLDG